MANTQNSFDLLVPGNDGPKIPNQNPAESSSSRRRKNKKAQKKSALDLLQPESHLTPKIQPESAQIPAEIAPEMLREAEKVPQNGIHVDDVGDADPVRTEIRALESGADFASRDSSRRVQKWYEWIAEGPNCGP